VLPFDVDLLGDSPRAAGEPGDEPDDATPENPDDVAQDDEDDLEAFDDDDEADAGAPPSSQEPDGGAAEGLDAGSDAGTPTDAGSDEADAAAPAPVAEALPQGKLEDAYAGDPDQVRATDPNVNVYIAADVLRQRELHAKFSELLSAIPQWQALLGGTGIDPLRDFDQLLISGPQFRNAAWVVVVVKYKIGNDRMRKALDAVVQRDKGKARWKDKDTAILGKNGDRLAMLVPRRKLLWILPESQNADLDRARGADPFARTPPAGMVVDLRTPKNAFAGSGFGFPETIDHMRIHFNLAPAGGYVVTAEGWDASPAEAKKHAQELEAAVAALDLVDKAPDFLKGFASKLELSVLGDTSFSTDGNKIYAKALVSEKQLARIVRFIKRGVDEREKKKKENAEKRKKEKAKLQQTKRILQRRQASKSQGEDRNVREPPPPGTSGTGPAVPAPSAVSTADR
jgi:hypothetical protein